MNEQRTIDRLTKQIINDLNEDEVKVMEILANHAHTMRVASAIRQTRSLDLNTLAETISKHFKGLLSYDDIAPVVINKTFELISSGLIDTHGHFLNKDFENAVIEYGSLFK